MTPAYLREDIAAAWQGQDPLQTAFDLQGQVYRDVPGRRTLAVQVGHKPYFVKLHYGVGWAEIIKNWLQLKRPIVGAENEYLACRDLAELGVPAPLPAAYGADDAPAARRRSYVLCDALVGYTSLEDVTEPWLSAAPAALDKHRVLMAVARFARTFHGHGFVHRDFYICHLLSHDQLRRQGVIQLAVLDLHRARRFAHLPDTWRRRDLAALLYSTLDLGYSRRDWLRFIRIYSGRPLRQELAQRGRFWQSVLQRAHKLYAQGLRKGLVTGAYTGHTS